MYLNKRGFKMRWLTWRARSARPYATVRQEVSEIEGNLDAMRAALPALRGGCQEFASRAEEISRSRALNRQMLSNHATLLDLLEVPQLQDTCIR
jgi:hypothetical protein